MVTLAAAVFALPAAVRLTALVRRRRDAARTARLLAAVAAYDG